MKAGEAAMFPGSLARASGEGVPPLHSVLDAPSSLQNHGKYHELQLHPSRGCKQKKNTQAPHGVLQYKARGINQGY